MPLKEIHYQRFIQVIGKEYNIVWTIDSLLKKINFLLPSNIMMNRYQLRMLIYKQHPFRVFKCREKNQKTHYIFKRNLPRE